MDDMDFGGGDLDLDMGGGDSGGGDLFGGDTGGGDMSGGDTGGDYGWDAGGGEDLNNAGGDYGWDAGGGEDLGGGLDDSASDTGSLDGLGEDTGGIENLNESSPDSLADTGSSIETENPTEVNDNLNGDGQGDEADNITENTNNENVVEESDNLNVESQDNLTDEKPAEDTEAKEDFEIGGHQNMSLEDVEQYQQEGNELSEQMRNDYPPDAETNNTLTNEETIREEEIMEEREPGAELSHSEFLEEQDKFEAEVEEKIEWPDNDGAVEGTEQDRNLEVGEEFTRRTQSDTVNDDGSFAGEKDISFEESSLPGNEEDYDVTDYKVTEEMPDDYYVTESEVAPAFDQEGGGTQYEFKRDHPWDSDAEPLDVPMQDMKDYGYIEEQSNNK